MVADAVTTPLVSASMLLKLVAEIERSLRVTASSPRPLRVPAVLAEYEVFTSEKVPVKVVTEEALTTPVVYPFNVFNTSAPRVVSLKVTA